MQSSYLAHMTLDVFDRVWGARGGLSLTVTIEGNTLDLIRFEIDEDPLTRRSMATHTKWTAASKQPSRHSVAYL